MQKQEDLRACLLVSLAETGSVRNSASKNVESNSKTPSVDLWPMCILTHMHIVHTCSHSHMNMYTNHIQPQTKKINDILKK